jgi:large subunit ribosomal protein L22e
MPKNAKKTVRRRAPANAVQKKKVQKRFVVDCSKPVDDGILEASQLEKFLHDRIKVDGKAGNLGNDVTVSRDKTRVVVTAGADIRLKKSYMKYLTKKYLKRQKLRDWLRVVSTSPSDYELRYFHIQDADSDDELSGEE